MNKRQVKYFSKHHKQNINVTLLKAGKFWNWYLKLVNAGAIALPGRKVVLMDHHWRNHAIISHELGHIEQYEKMGTIKFLFMYFALMARHGYQKHPLEIEARKHETTYVFNAQQNCYHLVFK